MRVGTPVWTFDAALRADEALLAALRPSPILAGRRCSLISRDEHAVPAARVAGRTMAWTSSRAPSVASFGWRASHSGSGAERRLRRPRRAVAAYWSQVGAEAPSCRVRVKRANVDMLDQSNRRRPVSERIVFLMQSETARATTRLIFVL